MKRCETDPMVEQAEAKVHTPAAPPAHSEADERRRLLAERYKGKLNVHAEYFASLPAAEQKRYRELVAKSPFAKCGPDTIEGMAIALAWRDALQPQWKRTMRPFGKTLPPQVPGLFIRLRDRSVANLGLVAWHRHIASMAAARRQLKAEGRKVWHIQGRYYMRLLPGEVGMYYRLARYWAPLLAAEAKREGREVHRMEKPADDGKRALRG